MYTVMVAKIWIHKPISSVVVVAIATTAAQCSMFSAQGVRRYKCYEVGRYRANHKIYECLSLSPALTVRLLSRDIWVIGNGILLYVILFTHGYFFSNFTTSYINKFIYSNMLTNSVFHRRNHIQYEKNTPEMTHKFIAHIEIGALDICRGVSRIKSWQEWASPVDMGTIYMELNRGWKGRDKYESKDRSEDGIAIHWCWDKEASRTKN